MNEFPPSCCTHYITGSFENLKRRQIGVEGHDVGKVTDMKCFPTVIPLSLQKLFDLRTPKADG